MKFLGTFAVFFLCLLSTTRILALNAPSNLSPGSNTSAGPVLAANRQTLLWSQPSGANSYLVNVRDVNTSLVTNYPIFSGTTTSLQLNFNQGRAYKWNMWAYTGSNTNGTQSPLSVSNYFQIGRPDLYVSSSLAPNPSTPIAGNSISIIYTLVNQGTGDSLACSNRIQIKPHGSSATLVENWFLMGPISSGQSSTLTNQLTIPLSASEGYYDMYIIVDSKGVNNDSNTNNDTFSMNFAAYVYAALPNLTPFKPVGCSDKVVITKSANGTVDDTNLTTTDTLYVSLAVLNNGNSATAVNFHTTLFIDASSFGPWNTAAPLNPNDYSFLSGYSLGTLPAGSHTLLLRADSAYEIVESNENDNEYTKTITIGSSIFAPSNLTAASSTSGILLGWQDNSSNENGFYIQRRQGTSYAYFSVAANQTNYTDTTVSQSIQYCYTVSATNNTGGSAQTAEQCATYVPSGPAPVAIIAGSLTPVTGTSTYIGSYSTGSGLQFSWSSSDGQHYYVPNPQFQFNSPGSYSIYLTVTDSANRSSSASIPINVRASNSGTSTFGVSFAGDPVLLATGNYVQNHVDLQMPGKGLPFEFKRFYNSKFSDPTGLPLGFGWTFKYNERLVDTGSNVLVIQGDGSTWTFFPTNSGYVGEPGIFDLLAKNNSNSTWTLADKSQTVSLFDTNGHLVSITDKNANVITCSYSGGILNQITDTAGRVVFVSTNDMGCISAITDPIGRTIQFQYDSRTNLVAVVDANGGTNRYFYDDNHQMTNACDAKGAFYIYNEYNPTNFTVTRQHDAYNYWTHFTYDFTNRITCVTNPFGKVSTHYFDDQLLETNVIDEAGNQQSFAYDANRNRVYIKDKNGNVTRYAYDACGNATNKIDALNFTANVSYDSLNNPTRRVDALNNVTTFGYDNRGNLIAITNALGFVSRVQYDSNGLPTVLTDARGFGATNQYDAKGEIIVITDSKGFASRLEYDLIGRKVRQIDALGRTNSFAYDNNDNLLKTTNALGFVYTYTCDANNNRILSINPRNATTTNLYDLKDRLISILAPMGQTNLILYDSMDRKIASFDSLNHRTSYSYDDIGNLNAITNALGQVTRFTFDAQGNQLTSTDPANHSVSNLFDALNRKVATFDAPISTNWTLYDALGRVSATTNANGQVTSFLYDPIGRLTNVIDVANQSAFFDYDQNGNRMVTTDPNGHSWTNVFDELNRLIEQDDPQGHKTLLNYDPVGNLTNKIASNNDSITYKYDAANQLTNIVYPSGTAVRFTYDSVGNRTTMNDGLGATTWVYDDLNRPKSVLDHFVQNVFYTYDRNGNRIALTYPGVNKIVRYGYDALNRMMALTNWLGGKVAYAYDSRGNLISSTNTYGTKTSYGYDEANRMIGLANSTAGGNVIASYSLMLDGLGNPRQAIHNQPIFPILSSQTNSYTYDSDNRLLSIDSQTVTHNANGDITNLGTNVYVYDFEDRLVKIPQTTTTNIFGYDGLGNRLTNIVNGQSRRFAIDRMGALSQVLIEYNSGGPTNYYIYGLGLVQQISTNGSSGAVSTYQFNIQGSTVALTDSAGNVTDSYAYDSFGVLANSDSFSSQPFRYLGRYGIVDDGTGLLYARARYFSPQLGRFLTKDPLTGKDGDGQSLNRYVYALNNALRFSDPTGLAAQDGFFRLNNANSTIPFINGGAGSLNSSLVAHTLLAACGFEQTAVGAACGAADTVIYVFEGNWKDAGLSVFSAIPVIGGIADYTKATRVGLRAAKGGTGPVLQGQAGVTRAITEIEAQGGQVLGREVTLQVGSGRTRLDLFIQNAQGEFEFIEVKNGVNAGLNANQSQLFPAIRQSGATPVGANAANTGILAPGVPIGPTPVRMIKYP